MDFEIRNFNLADKAEILSMMKEFYSSPAVLTNGSKEIFEKDFDFCIKENDFIQGYVFSKENEILGYAMVSKSFSTEFAKICLWLEDLYVKPKYRRQGIVSKFFKFIEENNKGKILKLEVELENENAILAYEKNGFKKLDYIEMKKEI